MWFTGGRCPEPGCEGQMEGSYDSGSVTFGYGTCDSRYTLSAPPILAGAHDADENPDVIRAFALTVIQKTARGFCHLCSGPLESSVRGPSGAENDHIFIEHECQECGAVSNTSALLQVFDHPAVVSAMYDAGVDYRRAFFKAPSTEMDVTERILDMDEPELEVSIKTDEFEVTILLNEEFEVAEFDRIERA